MKCAVLCVAARSVYKTFDDVECFDRVRGAESFQGGMPVVTHAPCRAWSARCAHQSKPGPGEKDLAFVCAQKLRECGGVFEHPAFSRAFLACGLPLPGVRIGDLWTIEVCQCWWGFPTLKRTWLCFAGIEPKQVFLPLRLHGAGGDRRREQLQSRAQRSATPVEFARWLVALARLV